MSHKQRFSQLITILVILTQVLAGVSGALPPNVAYAAAAAPVSVQPPKPLEAVAERRSNTGALQAATHQAAPELVHTTAPEVVAAAVPAAPLLQSGAVAVGNTVWQDLNANGLQESGEPGIPGVTVGLYDASGNAVLCTQAGRYYTYRDEFSTTGNTNSDGTLDWSSKAWVHTGTNIITTNGNPGGSLMIYGASTTANATRAVDLSVFVAPPTLSFDYNMNGIASKFNIQYSSDGGASFTTLAVLSDNGNGNVNPVTYFLPNTAANAQIRIQGQGTGYYAYFDNLTIRGQVRYPVTAVTDANGRYTFIAANCVQPNTNYQARIDTTQDAVIGLLLASPNAGGVTSNSPTLDDNDSDASMTTISGTPNAVINLTTPAAGANYGYDFGFMPVAIGNRVWKDTNANGLQESGEPGLAGVTVGLYDASGNAVMCPQLGRYDTYRDEFSTTGATNSNGTLSWSSKAWVHTNTSISSSNGNPGGSLAIYGASPGFYATRAVDLSVFASKPTLSFDYNMQGAASKFNIQYSSNGGTSFTTLAVLSDNKNGYKTITYTLPITVANAQIRIQGQGTGTWAYFDNLTIRGQVPYPVTTVTDANGLYTFTGMNCVQPSTAYQARIAMTQAALFGLLVTTQDAGGVTSNDPTLDDSDSDASLTMISGKAQAVVNATAPAGGANYSSDFGFAPVAIGNTVWKDLNANGLQDSGEPGIAGVTVGLYDASGNAVLCPPVGRYDTYLDQFSTTGTRTVTARLTGAASRGCTPIPRLVALVAIQAACCKSLAAARRTMPRGL